MSSSASLPDSNVTIVPAAFSYEPSGSWDGNDGNWSSFIVQVGTPPQSFRVFPSNVGRQLLVPEPGSCIVNYDPSNCSETRGILPFQGQQSGFLTHDLNGNGSTTFTTNGIYTSALENNLGNSVNASYGLDTVTVSDSSSSTLALTDQVVAGYQFTDFWLGSLGLFPGTINLQNYKSGQSTWLANLFTNDKIPSHSFGYTAGQSYTGSAGSLTLGGYDSNRFDNTTNSSFSFASSGANELSASLVSITGYNTLNGSQISLSPLATSSIQVAIDSTLPYIWLPTSYCDLIAQAFGLTYDNKTDLYLSNSLSRQKLQQSVMTLSLDGTRPLSIDLPFAALDLVASYPLYNTPTHYFPIRRAANDSQYTLGRTFLQGAYLIADFDRRKFTLAKATTSKTPYIVSILPPGLQNSSSPSPTASSSQNSSKSGISTGAIAGIAIALVVLVAAAILAFMIGRRRRRRRRARQEEDKARAATEAAMRENHDEPHLPGYYEPTGNEKARAEMPSPDPTASEVDGEPIKWGTFGPQEMESPPIVSELPSPPLSAELEGDFHWKQRSMRTRSLGSRSNRHELSSTSLDARSMPIVDRKLRNVATERSQATINEGPSFGLDEEPLPAGHRRWASEGVGSTSSPMAVSPERGLARNSSPPAVTGTQNATDLGAADKTHEGNSPGTSPTSADGRSPGSATSERPPTLRLLHDHGTILS